MSQRMHKQRGGSSIEFALLLPVIVPLLVGTLTIGTTMIRGLETVQVARDAGHLYARGVDFSLPGSKAMLARLGQSLGLAPAGGDGVVILSTISYIGRYQCKALNLADNATPPNPYPSCTNYGHFVFTHRLTIGNTSLRSSNYGDPLDALVNPTTGFIAREDYTKNAGTRADPFGLLDKPREDGTDGFQAGQFAYLVEAHFRANFTGMSTYSQAIF